MASTEEGVQVNPPVGEKKTNPVLRQSIGVILCLILLGALYMAATRFSELAVSFVYRDAFAVWDELFQILSLLFCLSISVLTWQIYVLTHSARHLAVGAAFFCTAVLDLLYLFALQGVPLIWIVDGSSGTIFWMAARFLLSGGLMIAALTSDRTVRRPLWRGAGTGLGFAAFIALTMLFYGGWISLPEYFPLDMGAFYLTMGLTMIGVFLYLRLYGRGEDGANYLLAALALAVAGLSEVVRAQYGQEEMYILGHAYRLFAYLLFFRVFFIDQVRTPYSLLHDTEDKLSAVVADLERQVDQRTQAYSQANAKLLKNLEDAKNIQMALLQPDFPHFGALDFAVRYMPCEQVGGDFYRVFRLDEEHVGIFFGDVAGHGVSAAMVNVFISQNVRFKVEYEGGHYRIFTPRGVLMHLYHTYNQMAFPEEIYIIIFYGIYNTRSGILTYSSAGFNMAPMVLGRDGTVRTLEMEGFPICNFAEHFKPTYKSRQARLDPGEVMVLYSDGLVEIDRKRPDLFSPRRVAECVRAYAGEGPQAVCDGLMDAYYTLRGKRKILDDVTVLSVKVLGNH